MKSGDRGFVRRCSALAGAISLTLLAAGAAAGEAAAQQTDTFPHERHSRLFPVCAGCHEGIPQGDRSRFYPETALCAGCHNGVDRIEVTWRPPSGRPSNLRFEHDGHPQFAREIEQGCAMCHTEPETDRMAILDGPRLELCWGCHTATSHQIDADCSFCHVPLAESGFGVAEIESISMPADHEDPSFLLEAHGQLAGATIGRCATCHTQDRCAACHVDTDRPEIQTLAPAPEGMELPLMVSRYEKPQTHEDVDQWLATHRTQAAREACATCHTQDDCRSCHVAPVPPVLTTLPTREQVVAPGVGVLPHPPSNHGSVFFLDMHSDLGASDAGYCGTCHEDSFCVSCHAGPSDGGYHPAGFVAQHSAYAFGRNAECTNCHSSEAFCRECHAQSGLTGFGRLGPGYHNAGAFWVIRHGQAARQGLESCISCHEQTDCTQCHGVAGAFKVSPHGSGFDPERAWERSPRTCIACHLSNPLIGREP